MQKKIRFSFVTIVLLICLSISIPLFNIFSIKIAFADENIVPTIHEETKIYRVDESAFEGAARETQYANQTAKITVLTHGYSGKPYHFSNDGTEEFTYNEYSIISALMEKTSSNGGIDLYRAKGITIENDDNTVEYGVELYKLSDDSYEATNDNLVDMLDDVSKHIVLVYESNIIYDGHKKVYGEFNTVLDTVSAQYKALTGFLPIYNLIGHSRGGVINLMFATEHPYNVDKVISVGTPYRGSRLGMIDGILEFSGMLENANDPKPQGMLDILSESTPQYETPQSNPTTAVEIRNAWNTVCAQGEVRANVISIGTMMDVSAISAILEDDTTLSYVGSDSNMVSILEKVVEVADELPGLVEFALDFANETASVSQCFGLNTLGDFDIEKEGWTDAKISDCRKILELVKNVNGNLIIADDLFIDTDSQLGQGFEDGVSYTGFSRRVKIFTAEDIGGERSVPTLPPIGHNIEAMNPDIVSFISNSLVCGFGNDNIMSIDEEFQGVYTDLQAFRIQPQYSGLREISISNGTLSMYKYTDTGLKYCEISGNDISNSGTFTYNLKNDEVYLVVMKPNYLSTAQFAFCHANTIVLGNNQIKYENDTEQTFKLEFEDNYFYHLSCEISGACFNVYDSNWTLLQSGQGEVSIETGENEILFVNLLLPNALDEYIDIECEKERKVEFIDDKFGKLVESISFINDASEDFVLLEENGYIFNGWIDNDNNIIVSNDIKDINQSTVTLYSNWSAIRYQIVYNVNGGVEIENEFYTIENIAVLQTNLSKENYVFIGWYENSDFSGDKVTYIPAGTIGNKQFYAKWVIAKHNVTLDVGSAYTGATIAYTGYEVMYGNEYTLPIPTYNGYEFNGWTYNGELVSDAQGSLIFLIEEENVTLMASWSPINFYIKIETIDNESTVKYLTTNGIVTTSETVTIEDFKNEVSINHFCPNCWAQENREVFYREGHVFDGLYYEGSLACWSILMPSITENVEIILTANYIKEEYIINFSNFTAEEVQPLIIEFGCNIEWYEFVGYECVYRVADSSLNDNLSEQFVKGEIFDYDKMPDISVGYESVSNSVIYIELEKTALITRLNLIDEEESYITSIAYDSATANIEIPYKTGYKFIGWFEFLDGSYTIVFDSNGNYVNDVSSGKWNRLDTDLTLYSQYTEIIYYVEYMANSGYGQVEKSEHVYGVSKELTINSYYKEHYSFVGWATSPNGAIEYHDEEVVLNLTAEEGDTIVLYAVWKANKYNIICANLLEHMDLSVKKYTYGVGLTTMPELYRTSNDVPMVIDTLYGWYSDSAFTIPVTSISPTSAGDITLYAKYDYKLFSSSLSGSYVINSKEESTPSLELNIHMKSIYYEQLQGTGLNKIKIQVTFDYYEEDDGYQHLYLYKGSTLIEDVEIDKSNKLDSEINKVVVFELLDVHDYKDTDYLYLKFGVTGWWPNEYYISNIRVTAWIIN